MPKGISPLIAAVLLIAFTISVATLTGPFMSKITKKSQDSTSKKAEKITTAASMGLKIRSADYNHSENSIKINIQNTGDKPVSNISVSVYGDRPSQEKFNQKLSIKEIDQFIVSTGENPNTEEIRVSLLNYPVTDSKEFKSYKRSCRELRKEEDVSTGVYKIDPDGLGGKKPFAVYCEMNANGGGWTRLNLRPKAHKGVKGLAFGHGRSSNSEGAYRWVKDVGDDTGYINLGLSDSDLDPYDETDTYGGGEEEAFFQKSSNQHCKKYAIGNHFSSKYKGEKTGWDYYDAEGRPIPPAQIEALNETVQTGVYYNGSMRAEDVDGPFPDGGDGHGGKNGFSIEINTSATYSASGGGPIVLWFSTMTNFSEGTTHAVGTDYGNGEYLDYTVNWKPVNTLGVPRFMGGKVDNNENLFSKFNRGCDKEHGSELTMKEPYFWTK